jgi:SAM-dependent MidA family methyltransferase
LNKVAEKISETIRNRGQIPFAEFMELALYCPVYGYYEREEDNLGRGGDFYTSVSVGSLFGELLAFQFAKWLETAGATQIVEAGAHRGALAKDILRCIRSHRPEIFERLEYWIVEPSIRRQAWQRDELKEFATKIFWSTDLSGCVGNARSPGVRGIIFSNELLDAMPVHRFGWDAREQVWFEWGVTLRQKEFGWVKLGAAKLGKSEIEKWKADGLLEVLPDGFTIEICPAAQTWWSEAARILEHGKLLTFDYGLKAEEFLAPTRSQGTLRAYRGHRLCDDLLAFPGQQDLTAHVNFTAIRQAGEAAGLTTETYMTQGQFLTEIIAQISQEAQPFGNWTSTRARQFQTLTHPEHLGRSFQVLLQSRDASKRIVRDEVPSL